MGPLAGNVLAVRRHPHRLRPDPHPVPQHRFRMQEEEYPDADSQRAQHRRRGEARQGRPPHRRRCRPVEHGPPATQCGRLIMQMYPPETINLCTGVSHKPRPEDYITKKTACSCAPPGTPHPLWTAFLDRVTDGNVELQKFLQRYIGYCCTGFTTEHVFVFAWGTGANGKSTFINTIARIFGTYATVADMNTFIASNNERHPTDLAKLYGARLVVAQETQRGRHWDEAKIKAITAGDKITARFMRQDYFDFTPTFKLFIVGNHKPQLRNVDEAIRRRMLLVPLTVEMSASERDKYLAQKLWDQERWAIMRWCVDGAAEWNRIGLLPPAVVRDATSDYFETEDTLGQWLTECVERVLDPRTYTLTRDLFGSWKLWCEPRNLKPGSEKAFVESLLERNFNKQLDPDTRRSIFISIVLRAP